LKCEAEALVHGAATIINAIALGKGAAFGVDLWTKAKVKLTSEPGVVEGKIVPDHAENTALIEAAVKRVFRVFGVENEFGAKVETHSNIPVARGLKSSSAAANAVVLATTAAIGETLKDMELLQLSVDAAFDAGVTVTGAFDDVCASYFGGVVITDNERRRIIKTFQVPDEVAVLFLVPPQKAYTGQVDLGKMRTVKPLVKIAYKEALNGNLWHALTLNGLVYSLALGYDTAPVSNALSSGALAAGLCGKGPAVTVVVANEKIDAVTNALKCFPGEILKARVNHEKARVLSNNGSCISCKR
jgi:shikimate kinase